MKSARAWWVRNGVEALFCVVWVGGVGFLWYIVIHGLITGNPP